MARQKKPTVSREFVPAAFSTFKADEIQVIRDELLKIAEEDNGVRVHRVLDRAREPAHPLHDFLTWDDREAAEKYRIDEVRRMCRAVRVRYIDSDGETVANLPMLVSVRERSDEDDQKVLRERRYIAHERAMADPVTREEIIGEALRQIDLWTAKYNSLTELQPVFEAIAGVKRSRRRAG